MASWSAFGSIAFTLAACGTMDRPNVHYDDLARAVAVGLVTPEHGGDLGSLADAALLARGRMADGMTDEGSAFRVLHAGVEYRYQAYCRDGTGALAPCGEHTAQAVVIARAHGYLATQEVRGTFVRDTTWSFRAMHEDAITATGTGASEATQTIDIGFGPTTYTLYASQDATIVVDAHGAPVGGSLGIALAGTQTGAAFARDLRELDVAGEVTLTGDGKARIVLDDDHAYSLDLATGEVGAPPVVID